MLVDIKENLIPLVLTPQQISYTYASEPDLLNTVLFGKAAKEWRDSNPNKKGIYNAFCWQISTIYVTVDMIWKV